MFTRIAHVCLNTRDLTRSVAYYEKLGFQTLFRFTRRGAEFGVYMKLSEGNFIEIFEDPAMGPVVNNGLAHFCLETADIDAVIARLTERGIPCTPKKLGVDNTWQIWLEDPDGNRFEVHQYTPASTQLGGGGSVEADW
jgi:catechol 2,3-dioxygenase-like lactoylglutathione lyase family enzyme